MLLLRRQFHLFFCRHGCYGGGCIKFCNADPRVLFASSFIGQNTTCSWTNLAFLLVVYCRQHWFLALLIATRLIDWLIGKFSISFFFGPSSIDKVRRFVVKHCSKHKRCSAQYGTERHLEFHRTFGWAWWLIYVYYILYMYFVETWPPLGR